MRANHKQYLVVCAVVLLMLLTALSCQSAPPSEFRATDDRDYISVAIYRVVDREYGNVCYVLYSSNISCVSLKE